MDSFYKFTKCRPTRAAPLLLLLLLAGLPFSGAQQEAVGVPFLGAASSGAQTSTTSQPQRATQQEQQQQQSAELDNSISAATLQQLNAATTDQRTATKLHFAANNNNNWASQTQFEPPFQRKYSRPLGSWPIQLASPQLSVFTAHQTSFPFPFVCPRVCHHLFA